MNIFLRRLDDIDQALGWPAGELEQCVEDVRIAKYDSWKSWNKSGCEHWSQPPWMLTLAPSGFCCTTWMILSPRSANCNRKAFAAARRTAPPTVRRRTGLHIRSSACAQCPPSTRTRSNISRSCLLSKFRINSK